MNVFDKENPILREDLLSIAQDVSIPWNDLKGKTVLITGATGLIGGLVAKTILYANQVYGNQTRIIAMVRDKAKAAKTFAVYAQCPELVFHQADIAQEIRIDEKIDYIIHAASVTQSNLFVEAPVDVLKTTLWSSDNLLSFAFKNKVASMAYLSTMEVYGSFENKRKITEDDLGYLNPLTARSSYPGGKRAAETLCYSYYHQYGVPVKILRLTQTFGPGSISLNDNRVFAQFCFSAMKGKDIVLHTLGETKRDYLYTADAVTALLIMLLKGESGQAYNAANSRTYTSIREMADLVAEHCASTPVKVIVEVPDDISKKGYAPTVKLNLDTTKIESLGWQAKTDLPEMYQRLKSFLDLEARV